MGCLALDDHERDRKHKQKVKERHTSFSWYLKSNTCSTSKRKEDRVTQNKQNELCRTYGYRRKHFKCRNFRDN